MIRIYGSSDDLIELASDDQKEFENEEFHVPNTYSNILAFSDGTLLEIRYDRWGVWRITALEKGLNFVNVMEAETDIESDKAYINASGIKWVVLSKEEIRRR